MCFAYLEMLAVTELLFHEYLEGLARVAVAKYTLWQRRESITSRVTEEMEEMRASLKADRWRMQRAKEEAERLAAEREAAAGGGGKKGGKKDAKKADKKDSKKKGGKKGEPEPEPVQDPLDLPLPEYRYENEFSALTTLTPAEVRVAVHCGSVPLPIVTREESNAAPEVDVDALDVPQVVAFYIRHVLLRLPIEVAEPRPPTPPPIEVAVPTAKSTRHSSRSGSRSGTARSKQNSQRKSK